MDEPWFKPVTVQSRAKIMRSLAKKRDAGAALPRQNKPVLNFYLFRYPRYGQLIKINNVEVQLFSMTDLRRFFQVERSTLYRWRDLGMIPPAIFSRMNKYQKPQKFWLRDQIRVMCYVINDLRRQGIYRLTPENTRFHSQMIQAGNEYAMKRYEKRVDLKGLKDSFGPRGVVWMD